MDFLKKYKNLKNFKKVDLIDFDTFYKLKLLDSKDDIVYNFKLTLEETEYKYLKYINNTLAQNLEVFDIKKTLSEHINLLHEFNEAKDCLQHMISKIAEKRGLTIREINKELDLEFCE